MTASVRITLFAALFPLVSIGCVEDHTEAHHTVPLQDATSVDVTVVMNNGDLDLFGGSVELLEADLVYPVDDLPTISYQESDGRGYLEIMQPDDDNPLTIDKNRWDLQLNDDVELGLFIEMDSGDAELQLGRLEVSRLDFEIDNGDATFDLTGAPVVDLDARIDVENGHVHVLIPSGVSAQIVANVDWGDVDAPRLSRNWRGDYILEGPADAPVMRFDIDVEHGEIDLDLVD